MLSWKSETWACPSTDLLSNLLKPLDLENRHLRMCCTLTLIPTPQFPTPGSAKAFSTTLCRWCFRSVHLTMVSMMYMGLTTLRSSEQNKTKPMLFLTLHCFYLSIDDQLYTPLFLPPPIYHHFLNQPESLSHRASTAGPISKALEFSFHLQAFPPTLSVQSRLTEWTALCIAARLACKDFISQNNAMWTAQGLDPESELCGFLLSYFQNPRDSSTEKKTQPCPSYLYANTYRGRQQ